MCQVLAWELAAPPMCPIALPVKARAHCCQRGHLAYLAVSEGTLSHWRGHMGSLAIRVGAWAQQSSAHVLLLPERWMLETLRRDRACILTAAGGVLVRAVLAVQVPVTGPALGDAVPVATLEVGRLTGVVDGC